MHDVDAHTASLRGMLLKLRETPPQPSPPATRPAGLPVRGPGLRSRLLAPPKRGRAHHEQQGLYSPQHFPRRAERIAARAHCREAAAGAVRREGGSRESVAAGASAGFAKAGPAAAVCTYRSIVSGLRARPSRSTSSAALRKGSSPRVGPGVRRANVSFNLL